MNAISALTDKPWLAIAVIATVVLPLAILLKVRMLTIYSPDLIY